MTELSYLYCIVPSDVELTALGELADVRAIKEGQLQALVSTVAPADQAASEQDLNALASAHHRVSHLLLAHCTPIPLRLGTTLPNDDEVRAYLRRKQATMMEALASFQQRREWGMKLYVDRAALEPRIAREAPALRALPPLTQHTPEGARYLLRKRRERVLAQACEHWIEGTIRRLARLAADHADQWAPLAPYQNEAWNAAALVHRSVEPAFLDTFEQCARELAGHATLKVTGPWAPYSFVPSAEIEAT